MHDGRVVFPSLSCVGFDPPMAGGAVTVRNHRVLPLKAHLLDADGAAVSDSTIPAPPILRVLYDAGSGSPVDVTDRALVAGRGTAAAAAFSFDGGGKWQLNLDTAGYGEPGTYRVRLESGDPTRYTISPTCEATFVIE